MISWRFDGTTWVKDGKWPIECELCNEHHTRLATSSWNYYAQCLTIARRLNLILRIGRPVATWSNPSGLTQRLLKTCRVTHTDKPFVVCKLYLSIMLGFEKRIASQTMDSGDIFHKLESGGKSCSFGLQTLLSGMLFADWNAFCPKDTNWPIGKGPGKSLSSSAQGEWPNNSAGFTKHLLLKASPMRIFLI